MLFNLSLEKAAPEVCGNGVQASFHYEVGRRTNAERWMIQYARATIGPPRSVAAAQTKGPVKTKTATGACQSPSITVHGECEDRMDDKRGARKMQTRQPQEEWQLKSWNGGSRLGVCVCVKRVSFLGQAQPVLRLLQLQE